MWRFIVPALNAKEKKYAIPFVLSSVVLFLAGGSLAYLTVAQALEFLISWAGEDVGQVFSVSSYITLIGLMIFAFGVGFLLPVLIVFLQLVGAVQPTQLLKGWRYALVGITVTAAVITPSGDPVTLMLLAGPMLRAVLRGGADRMARAAAPSPVDVTDEPATTRRTGPTTRARRTARSDRPLRLPDRPVPGRGVRRPRRR